MTPAAILLILEGVLGAAPQLLALFTAGELGQAGWRPPTCRRWLSQYGIDRAVFAAAIAQAEAAMASPPAKA